MLNYFLLVLSEQLLLFEGLMTIYLKTGLNHSPLMIVIRNSLDKADFVSVSSV